MQVAVGSQWMDNNNSVSYLINSLLPTDPYTCPEKPAPVVAWAPSYLAKPGIEHRETFRTYNPEYALLTFRVRRQNFEELLWQLRAEGVFEKDHAYDPHILPYWTIGLRVKVRSYLCMGRVMDALVERMGIRIPGVRFCLDGFFGMRGLSDVFNNSDACPWMEVSKFSTVHSLHLQHGDNIFISIATERQIDEVNAFRRHKVLNVSKTEPTIEVLDKEQSDVIGQISYDQEEDADLNLFARQL